MTRRYLVTGGAGFIGSNFVRHIFETDPTAEVVNLDVMTYAAVPQTIEELSAYSNHRFIQGDIRDPGTVAVAMDGVDIVVHFAAESHVDRSIATPTAFIETNVLGTGVLLEEARRSGVERFVHISTDEVYGPVLTGKATEDDVLRPSSVYSASKAGADLLALSYATTYGMDVVVTRCTNNYGPYQYPEKMIPLFVTRLLGSGRVPLYGDGLHERDWLHVADHCAAIGAVAERGEPGRIYNIGADAQRSNLSVVRTLLDVFGLPDDRIEYVKDRPAHDRRYAVDSSRVRDLGWSPTHSFESGIADTIAWYRLRADWWTAALDQL